MRNSPPTYFCALLFCLLISAIASGQLSKKHYIPPLTYAEFGNAAPQDQFFYISTPNNLDVAYTITPIGQPAASIITGTVTNNNPVEIFLGDGPGQLFQPSQESSTVINNRGYIIDAEDVIYVSVRMRAGNSAQAGALVSKGTAALGTVFRSGSYTNENPQSNYLNFFSFMATQNNTTVVIDDLPPGIDIRNYTGTFPITVNLNEGESYVVATNSNTTAVNRDGLIGTLIESDKPIVVNSGSANGSFHNGNGRDYGIDQIVGLSSVGNEYIFVRGDGADTFENVLIVAHEDDTEIAINSGAVIANINAGDYYLIEGNEYNANGNMYVNTSKNVFAYQGVGGNGNNEPNQGMFFVPPLSCNNRGDLNSIANIRNIGPRVYNGGITIVTNRGSDVEINGQPIADFAPQGPFDVDGNPDYVTYKVLGLNDNVSVLSSGELYCAYFNFNGVATSGSFYSGFPSPPEIDFNLDITAAGNCIPNITLEAFNIDVFDSVEWHYDDGSGFVPTGETTASFKPLLPGGYKLVGTILCSGLTFDSPAVRVSVCPDDFDGDAVIDNVDVDIDNDGVLNCDESLGDVIIDLSNNQVPILNFQDGTTNNTFVEGEFFRDSSSGNTIELDGQNNGDFTSTLGSAITATIEYRMNFQDDVNLLFRERNGYIHTPVEGEIFSIIIGPSEQNITLVDPDNQLLVDTDFDGIFETGVDNFSTSEIRFRYNPAPNGPRPFRFVASKIDYAIFRHTLSNTSDQSSFQGHFGLTCFKRDSDNDGSEDAFDIDNDNDGIPDLLEATGSIISLSNADADFDGLDDVFNNTGVLPFDTDGDGIPDFLDLDSDNDGIFDLFEAGHNLADSDLNGVIDNAETTSGSNGLVDALETAPDSFTLSYTVANTDADTLLNATELDSDNDGCFDVIEAGFTDDDADGILSQSPVQVDANGLVLNAADGYTLPNADYTNFAPIVLNSAFEDVEFCESSTATIFIDTSADIFQWQVSTNGTDWNDVTNDTNYSGTTTNTLTIDPLPRSFDGYQYRVLLERTGNACGEISNEITLSVSPLPVVNSDVILSECDTDTDGIAIFNLLNALPNLSANYTNETFAFFSSQTDAENNTNPISNPNAYTNTNPTSETIWVRVTSSFGCVTITSIDLHVSTTQVPAGFLRTFNACDDYLDSNGNDNANNDDRDGITAFDFSSVTTDILNLFPPNQQLSISYYQSEIDAQTQQNPITNPDNYRNSSSPNNQQIYVRIDDLVTNVCSSIGVYIQLNVDPVPEINAATNIELCDDDNDGFVQGFNLDSRISDILGSQSATNSTVSFHLLEEDARNDLNAIINTTDYTNTTPNQQRIYVRITNNTTGCFTAGIAFDVITVNSPTINPIANLELCDDDTDGSAQNGFLQNINLDGLIPDILGNLDPTIHQVTFHQSNADATSGSNALSSPYINTTAFNQTIYVRVENTVTGCVNTTNSFDIIINSEPQIQSIPNLSFCDDDADGILSNIDLDALIPDILGNLNPDDFQVTFHLTALDAEDGNNPITSPFTNTSPNEQMLFVRVTNINTGCVNTSSLFNVIVQPLPIVNLPSDLEQCDDDADGFVNGFNMSGQTSIILGNLDPTTYPVTFHLSESDAELGINPIANTDSFTNTVSNQQTIYVRVENLNTSCFNTSISFDLIVNPLPEINVPANFIACDDGLVDGSNTNGIAHNIDLDSLIEDILGTQNPTNFSVTFHLTENEAVNGSNAIVSPFTNTTAFSQTLYIRVENLQTSCLVFGESFDIVVNPAPTINTIPDVQLCDNDEDGDETNGFIQNIDLDSQIPAILGDNQNPDDFEVTFYESFSDAQLASNALTSPYSNTTPDSQVMFVRVVNRTTGCLDVARNFRIEINTPPQFEVTTPQFICLGDDPLELGVENPEDTYDYFWIDPAGNTVFGETIQASTGGTYTVTATNTNGSNCSTSKDIVVGQSSLAAITDEHVIIDDGDDNNSILINNNPDVLGAGDYEFALLNNERDFVYEYQDEPFFGNLRGGIYIILVRDKNGCGEAELEVAVLEIPKFFTPNDDGVKDLWNLEGITQEFIDYFPSSKISVFNRYGKFIADFTITHPGWNGRYNGQLVASNDYWVRVELTDRNGKVRVETRNFSLLRR
jgi:gliding motility-associated-like protein